MKSSKSDFRHIGTEKDAGALQDLLRRVMEIDADITQTPVVEFKPNVNMQFNKPTIELETNAIL